jgi:dTDP-3,4-didehydro-2,6-dideoxy-alpha-D-glucose 3-reductase
MKKFKLGILGTASIAQKFMINAISLCDGIELAAIASRDPEKAASTAKKFSIPKATSYDELVSSESIDIIYMPLPTGLHLEWGLKCLEAGKHVLFEKSLGRDSFEVKQLIDLARKKNLLIDENYMFSHHSQQQVLKESLFKIGIIRSFTASFGFPPLSHDNFRYNKKLGGGALLDAGGYVLKVLDVLFPDTSVEIKDSNLTFSNGVDIAGSIYATMDYEGYRVPCFLSFGFDNFYKCGIEIWGSKGLISTNRTFTAGPNVEPEIQITTNDEDNNICIPKENHFIKKLDAFIFDINLNEFEETYKSLLRQSKFLDKVAEQNGR